MTIKNEIILYQPDELAERIEVRIDEETETIWLTQQQIANLFGTKRPAITKHLGNIFKLGELDENVVSSILEQTTQHGAIEGKTQTRSVKFYNLDAIISVGYRVNSSKATQFRIWATQLLKRRPFQNMKNLTEPSGSNPILTKSSNNSQSQRIKKAKMNNQLSCLSWLKNIRVHLCPFVLPNPSVFSVYPVVKTGGAE